MVAFSRSIRPIEPISLEMDTCTSGPITSRHSFAASSSWSLRTVENTLEMAMDLTPFSRISWKKARAASRSKGASSLPSCSKPPPMILLPTAIPWISSAQSSMGRTAIVAGAPSRRMPMGARFFRSTMALVHWVVPSIAWRILVLSIPDTRSTSRTAQRIPSYTSPEVGYFISATTCKFSSMSTASVLVPPTSTPSLYIMLFLLRSAPPGGYTAYPTQSTGVPPGQAPPGSATFQSILAQPPAPACRI